MKKTGPVLFAAWFTIAMNVELTRPVQQGLTVIPVEEEWYQPLINRFVSRHRITAICCQMRILFKVQIRPALMMMIICVLDATRAMQTDCLTIITVLYAMWSLVSQSARHVQPMEPSVWSARMAIFLMKKESVSLKIWHLHVWFSTLLTTVCARYVQINTSNLLIRVNVLSNVLINILFIDRTKSVILISK